MVAKYSRKYADSELNVCSGEDEVLNERDEARQSCS